MTAKAKLFTHGRSQAVRLPKEFRLPGSEVNVSKVGDMVILTPLDSPRQIRWELIDDLSDEPFPERQQPPMPPDRKIFRP